MGVRAHRGPAPAVARLIDVTRRGRRRPTGTGTDRVVTLERLARLRQHDLHERRRDHTADDQDAGWPVRRWSAEGRGARATRGRTRAGGGRRARGGAVIGGESGVGKSRLVRRARARGGGERRACSAATASRSATASSPYAPACRRCGGWRATEPVELASCWAPAGDELARLARARRRRPDGGRPPVRRSPRRAVRAAAGAVRPPRRGGAAAAGDRGHPLGRPLDARPPRLPDRQRPSRAPLVVCTYRTDGAPRRPSAALVPGRARAAPAVKRMEVARSRPTSSPPAARDPRRAARRAARRRLLERTEGNAFFTEELLAASEQGRAAGEPARRADVRIEALPEEAQRVLRVAATPGGASAPVCSSRVLALPEDALDAALREAVRPSRARAAGRGRVRVPARAGPARRSRRPAPGRARAAAPRAGPGARRPTRHCRPRARSRRRAGLPLGGRPQSAGRVHRLLRGGCRGRAPGGVLRGQRALRARGRLLDAVPAEQRETTRVELLRRAARARTSPPTPTARWR